MKLITVFKLSCDLAFCVLLAKSLNNQLVSFVVLLGLYTISGILWRIQCAIDSKSEA